MEKFSLAWYDARRVLEKQAFANNKTSIIEALKVAGISHAFVKYSGSGDDGGDMEQFCTEKGSEIETPNVMVQVEYLNYTEEPTILQKNLPLSEVLNDLCEKAILFSGNDGYENGLGGGGTMTIDTQAGTLVLDHHDIIEAHEETMHVF